MLVRPPQRVRRPPAHEHLASRLRASWKDERARPGRNALWWREFGSRYNAQEIIRGMLGVIGSRWFPSKPANAVGLCGALQSSRTHAVCAVRCAAVVPVVALPTVVPVARADVTQPPRAAAAAAKRF